MKTIIILVLLVWAWPVKGQEATPYTIGESYTLRSSILGEDRPYLVYLPASYSDSVLAKQEYPVLYLLDGDAHFHSASGVVQFMSSGINANIQIPELIVVAIPNTDRSRDLTPTHTLIGYLGEDDPSLQSSGGGDRFIRFISEELAPYVDSIYRTRPYRILAGHSFGGLIALHALLNHPGVFQGIIAIDPSLWWDNEVLVTRLKEARLNGEHLEGDVFVTLANNPVFVANDPNPKRMELAGRAFAANLALMEGPKLRSGMKYYSDEDHGSVPLISLYDGLMFVFEGYKSSAFSMFDGASRLAEHFDRFSKRIGMSFKPPESYVGILGGYLASVDSTALALSYLRLNVVNYPNSWNVHESLAAFYLAQSDTLAAIEQSKKVLALNPSHAGAKERLRLLAK